jgi:hypothetical protein
MAFEDLDGGGLAGSIGTEEGEHLAGLDRQVDAIDGAQIAVTLDETADFDGRHGWGD